MLDAFVITLREGLEAFLIVAISIAYLRKSGRQELVRAVNWGIAVAVAASLAGGIVLYRAANQELLDGPLAIVAAISVAWLVVHMWRAGRQMKGDIEVRLNASLQPGAKAFIGVFLFTLLMISREGMETALLLLQLKQSIYWLTGAALGVLGAAGLAWLWSKYGHRINLGLFFQVTAIFLFVFVIQVFIQGFHELTEQGLLPYSEVLHNATEVWSSDGKYGHYFSWLLLLAPATWLAICWLRHPRRSLRDLKEMPGVEPAPSQQTAGARP